MTIIIMYDKILFIEYVFRETLLKQVFNLRILVFSLLISQFCLLSCSNNSESKLVYTENNTIKQNVKDKQQDITWTQEIEGERLSQLINRNSMTLGSGVVYNRELFKINRQTSIPVYPYISDFGNLDTSSLNPEVKEKLNKFCRAFSSENHSGAESFFYSKYIFNYVFFINDFEEGCKQNFGKGISAKAPEFSKWIYGEPFIGSDIMQIPVRFYADCGTIDITVFLSSYGNNEFYQITIDRWQKV